MKILVIRGENLASLAEEFELVLDREPLSVAGVFALTGPVGAGKSTVLDAMALALFARVPRLEGGGKGVKIQCAGESSTAALGSKDPATLLRRGTARGFAEVEFKGGDGNRYRARWSVHRARSRPTGKMQPPVHRLFAVEGETPEEHRELTGAHNRETAAQVEACLGLDFDQFRRSVLLAQGEFAAFLKAKSDDRAQLLARVTGTEIYRRLGRMAFDRSRDASRELEELQARLVSLPVLEAAARHELDRQWAQSTEQLDAVNRGQIDLRHAQAWHEQSGRIRSMLHEAERAQAAAVEKMRACEGDRSLLLDHERCADGRERAGVVKQADTRRKQAIAATQDAVAVAVSRESAAATLQQDWLQRSARFVQRATAARDRVQARMGAVEVLLLDAQSTLQRRQDSCDAAPSVARQFAIRGTHAALVGTLRDASSALDELMQCRTAAAHARRRSQRLAALVPRVQARLELAVQDVAARDAASQEAARALRAVEQALDLEAQRNTLETGSPCPVCGSKEHPFAESSTVHALHDDAQQRLARLEILRTDSDRVRVASLGREARMSSASAAAERAWVKAAETRDQVEQRWRIATSAARAAMAASFGTDNQGGSQALTPASWGEEPVVRTALPADFPALAAMPEGSDSQVQRTDDSLDEVRENLQVLCAAGERYEGVLRRDERRASIVVKRLERARDRVDQVRDQLHRIQRASGVLGASVAFGLERQREALAESNDREVQPELDAATGADPRILADVEEAQDPAEDAHGLASALESESDGLRKLESELEALRQRALESRGAGAAAKKAESDAMRAWESSIAERDAQCAQLGVTAAKLDELAAMGADVLARMRTKIEGASAELASADALLAARHADMVAHEATAAPVFTSKETAAALPQIESIAEQLATRQHRLREGRARDDVARDQATSASAELEERRAHLRPWIELGHRMGDGQGQKFEQFAQSLTMHALLVGANRHLEDLAPRYELAAVAGVESLELQVVDRELGDTVRSVRSLSGGETFLVSLALALGLTTLSAGRTRIESLFLDEGFGSLDPKTVDTALEALDALQATGCQVCVISHVEGMAERVGCSVEVRPLGGGASELAVGGSFADVRL